ncbi:MAG: 1-deoxy-D-xylulose-5-phosphate synthase [Clostridia bacterium]|nr:1-deoxy-D-xylulose-5-phosphate synthase [Clostridia bacterium]
MEYRFLNQINSIEDLKRMDEADLPALCAEIRAFMIENVAKTGGHLASSLGAVELIVAMHRVFDSPQDKLVFDVGHQAYAHKILTGRRDVFHTLRTEDGLSGFPKREESEHDAFNTGHASTSISAALGYARAMRLRKETGTAVALVGDGAMTGGLAFEAMDDAGREPLSLIVLLNDNEMSISKNVGGISNHFASMRSGRLYNAFKRGLTRVLEMSKTGKWLELHMKRMRNRVKKFLMPNLPFEHLGFTYIGPIDGHDVKKVIRYLERVRDLGKPVVLHTITQKGKGYSFAEENPEAFHGVAPFSVETGKPLSTPAVSNSAVFGQTLEELAAADERIVAITAAMPTGTGLSEFAEAFPDRFFDVGIAEEHAVTMAAAFAAEGMRPVVAVYSSFLQRAYDELLHDVCLQNLPVVIALDRAGLVGEDGETHQGIYDPAYLASMPNLVVYSPATQAELRDMLRLALQRSEPAVVRYCRGAMPKGGGEAPLAVGKWLPLRPATESVILATGTMLPAAREAAERTGAGLTHMRFLSPLDESILEEYRSKGTRILVVEENVASVAPQIALRCNPCRVQSVAIPNHPVAHGSVAQQRARFGLTVDGIEAAWKELMSR